MTKKQIITIGGLLGSGKSSASKQVAEKLNYHYHSAGNLMRQLAKENGYDDVREFNFASEGSSTADDLVDQKTVEIGKTGNQIVFDSHMAWYFIPDSFKVFLIVDPLVASKRILNSMSEERKATEHVVDDINEYAKLLEERKASNIRRYKALYSTDPYTPEHYDCVVDATSLNLEEVVEEIIKSYQDWLV